MQGKFLKNIEKSGILQNYPATSKILLDFPASFVFLQKVPCSIYYPDEAVENKCYKKSLLPITYE